MCEVYIIETASRFLKHLARLEYGAIVEMTHGQRLSVADLQAAIADYGGIVVEPPSDFSRHIDALRITANPGVAWSVCVPVWTADEGLSDLTAELTIEELNSGVSVSLDNLHVL